MGTWHQLDAFRGRVQRAPLIEGAQGPFASLQEARAALGKSDPDRFVVLGWELFLSRRRQGEAVRWHLAARLYPQGCAPTKKDWEILDRIAARVGAPVDLALVLNDLRAAAHWSWPDEAVA